MAKSLPGSYIVVGAGVFGASTAYHLVKERPEAAVSLVDLSFPCQVAASWDWNKVARADYEDDFYMEMALDAMDSWTHDPLYSIHSSRTGVAWIMDDPEYPGRIAGNYKKFNKSLDYEVIEVDKLKTLYSGLFAELDATGVGKIFLNRDSGLVQARDVLQAVIDEAEKGGAQLVTGDISKLTFDETGGCSGVITTNGRALHADAILLCTGAYTEKLMADSAPERPDLQINGRLVASGIISGLLEVGGERLDIFEHGTILVHNVGKTSGKQSCHSEVPDLLTVSGEWMPPTADRLIKFNRDVPWRYTQHHKALDRDISAPPPSPDYDQWTPSEGMKREIQTTATGIFGSLIDDSKWHTYRQCWDAVAPDANFLISPLPECRGLYFATGGSFHGWKFLPVIRKYVVQMLNGELSKGRRDRWSWSRSLNSPKGHSYQPTREWKDV